MILSSGGFLLIALPVMRRNLRGVGLSIHDWINGMEPGLILIVYGIVIVN